MISVWRPLDSRADIWSFGVSLFELLTLQRPRLGPAAPRAVELYRRKHPDSGVPEAIWGPLLGILEPDVVQRPDCFSDIGEQMRKLYREITGEAYPRQFPSHPEPAGGTPPAAGSERQRAMVLLAGALRRAGRDPAEADRFVLSWLGGPRSREAELRATLAIEIRQSLVGQRSEDEFAVDLAASYLCRGILHRNLGNLKAASDDYACTIRLCRRCNARGQFAAKDDVLCTAFLNRSAPHLATRYFTAAVADADHARLRVLRGVAR